MMPDRIRRQRRRSLHAPRSLPAAPAREPVPRPPARNGETLPRAGHGEDAGPSADGPPPREDRAG